MRTTKGQMTFVNLSVIFITIIIYLSVCIPVMTPMITAAAVMLTGTPNDYTQVTVMAIELIPAALAAALIFTALNWSSPRQAGGY